MTDTIKKFTASQHGLTPFERELITKGSVQLFHSLEVHAIIFVFLPSTGIVPVGNMIPYVRKKYLVIVGIIK